MFRASAFILLIMLSGVSAAYSPDKKRIEAQEYFNGPAEKSVKDSLWTGPFMFKVGVLDNGSNRDGFAMYVCEVLRDRGFREKGLRVQVIDIAKLARTNKWVKIGQAQCN